MTDDREALRYGRRRGILTRDTLDLFTAIVADGDLPARAAYDLLHAMADRDRSLRLPSGVRELT